MDPGAIRSIVSNRYGDDVADWVLVYRTMYLSEKLNNPKIKSKQLDEILFENMKRIATSKFTIGNFILVYYINKFLPIYFKNLVDSTINSTGATFKRLDEYVDEAIAKDKETNPESKGDLINV